MSVKLVIGLTLCPCTFKLKAVEMYICEVFEIFTIGMNVAVNGSRRIKMEKVNAIKLLLFQKNHGGV